MELVDGLMILSGIASHYIRYSLFRHSNFISSVDHNSQEIASFPYAGLESAIGGYSSIC